MMDLLTGFYLLLVLICVLCAVLCRSYFRRMAKTLKDFNDEDEDRN